MVSPRSWSFLCAVLPALALVRCAGAPAAPSPQRGSAPTATSPAPRWTTPAEAEAALVALEDRRAFEPETLAAAARSAQAETRARAALALGRIADDRGRSILRDLLRDTTAEVRAAAAFACAPAEDATLTSDLIPLLADADRRVAAMAAKSIGFLGRGDGQDALIAAIPAAAAPEPRASMLAALWKTSNAATQTAALRFAADTDSQVRGAAIYALARKPVDGSQTALTDALADTDPDTAAIAARGLGILGRKESLVPLAAALDSGKTPLVINALVAMELIFEKNPTATVPEDRKQRVLALGSDANGNVAVSALVLLRWFAGKDREVFRRLWAISTTGEGRRRQVALLSVVAVLKAKAETAIQAAANSGEPALRAAAAESIAFLPLPDAKPYCDRFAADRAPLVRIAALASLKTPEAVQQNRETVLSALTDPDAGVRAAAIEAPGAARRSGHFASSPGGGDEVAIRFHAGRRGRGDRRLRETPVRCGRPRHRRGALSAKVRPSCRDWRAAASWKSCGPTRPRFRRPSIRPERRPRTTRASSPRRRTPGRRRWKPPAGPSRFGSRAAWRL